MHIHDIFRDPHDHLSFEFFPPKTDGGSEELFANIAQLQALQPSFVSVTYGAGGSTRERTHDLIVRIKQTTNLRPIPHLTCVCHSEEELAAILERYAESGIENILALGGDPPRDRPDYDRAGDAFQYARRPGALHPPVQRARRAPGPPRLRHRRRRLSRGHPGTPNRLKEMDYLKAKVDAGADYICTQLFFDNRDFLRLPRALRAGRHPRADHRRHHADHVAQRHGADGRAGARRRGSRRGCCGRSTAAATTRSCA